MGSEMCIRDRGQPFKGSKRAGLGARGVVVGLWFGPAAGGLVEDGGRRWASLLKAASEQDSARAVS